MWRKIFRWAHDVPKDASQLLDVMCVMVDPPLSYNDFSWKMWINDCRVMGLITSDEQALLRSEVERNM